MWSSGCPCLTSLVWMLLPLVLFGAVLLYLLHFGLLLLLLDFSSCAFPSPLSGGAAAPCSLWRCFLLHPFRLVLLFALLNVGHDFCKVTNCCWWYKTRTLRSEPEIVLVFLLWNEGCLSSFSVVVLGLLLQSCFSLSAVHFPFPFFVDGAGFSSSSFCVELSKNPRSSLKFWCGISVSCSRW